MVSNLFRFFDCKKIKTGLREAVDTKGEPYSPTENFDPRAAGLSGERAHRFFRSNLATVLGGNVTER
jgi:hypothetical protein